MTQCVTIGRIGRIAVSFAMVAGLAACNEKAAEVAPKLRPVVVQTVNYQPRQASRSFVGTVRPRIETDLAFRVTGKIEKRLVEVGDRVKAGQVLASLDTVDLGLQKDQAEAELKAATGSRSQANAELERFSQLRKQGWSTAAEFDRQKSALDEAEGRMSKARHALTLAGNAFAYGVLRADSDAVVMATMAEPGQVLASGTPAFRLARSGEKEAVIALPEQLVERARTANAVATLWSGDRSYPATLRELSPSADGATRTYQARFTLGGSPQDLARAELGMTATITLEDKASDRVARLPLSALYNDGHGASIWVVDPASGALTLKPVEIAGYEARDVLIRAGIAEGDRAVTLGVQKLDAQQKVRISQVGL